MVAETAPAVLPEAGIELRGIERVPPSERHDVRIFDNLTMWLSANLVLSTVALGTLAVPIFQMGFWDSALAIVLFNLLGVLPVAFFATLGPKLGLRQMTISRFSFGIGGGALMGLFNVAACIGWSTVNVIVGAQLITVLSGGHVPAWAGILLIAGLTTFVSLYGYTYVHRYERIAWIPMAVIFAVLVAVAGPHVRILHTPAFGIGELAAFVSFGGAVFGFSTGWSSYAADYNVNQPEETPAARVFWLTFIGCTVPCILLEVLGMALSTAFKGDTAGSLLAAALHPLGGFGSFLLVLLALSIVANNIPNDYSLGLSMQVLGKAFQKVNRAAWTLIGAVVYVLVALVAARHPNQTLENFLLLIAYWLAPWCAILTLEHFVFRKRRYNADDWDTPGRLPRGWAALVAMGVGLVGVYLGAAQVMFVGPIAKAISPPFGMDIGFELGALFAAAAYLLLRPVEKRQERFEAGA